MDAPTIVITLLVLLIGAAAGFFIGMAVARSRTAADLAQAQTAERLHAERLQALEADAGMTHELAALMGPLAAQVNRLHADVTGFERERADQFARLDARLGHMSRVDAQLQASTSNLVAALNASGTRGSWGELQLKRVVEAAGMLDHVDFDVQVTVQGRSGERLRPDMVVHLPGDRQIVVDAKAPLDLGQDTGSGSGSGPAGRLRSHIRTLASKAYWNAFGQTPDFVVCFVPNEGALSAALQEDPRLFEEAFAVNVIPASPATLVALLRTVALGWRQYELARSARELLATAQELHGRIGTMAGHLVQLGKSMNRSVEDYNRFVGSVESRLLVTARRLTDMGAGSTEIPIAEPLDAHARSLTAPEFQQSADRQTPDQPAEGRQSGPGQPSTRSAT